jgi:Tol biopolymer transport system component
MDGASHWPMWTPKGDRITFRSWKTGGMTMWWMPADRSGPEEMLPGEGRSISPESWSPDGKFVAYTRMDYVTNFEVWLASTTGDRKSHPLLTSKFSEASPKFSPDGKWLAYCSNESGRPETYIVQVADGQARAKIQVSTDGGIDPVWRRKGGELFYRNGDKMMAVSVSGGATPVLSKPRELWTRHFMVGSSASCGMPGVASANYDVTADGERFVMIEDKDQDMLAKQINVVLNFGEELKRGPRPARF